MAEYKKIHGSCESIVSTATEVLSFDNDKVADTKPHFKTKKERKHVEEPKQSKFNCFPSRPKYEKKYDGVPRHVPLRDGIVQSGHLEFQSLYATNDMVTPSFTINRLGAPNDSTMMCGCDNISCPFCNIVENIKQQV